MDIKILDKSGQQLTTDQIRQLNIWNDAMSHICASVLERMQREEISNLTSVART